MAAAGSENHGHHENVNENEKRSKKYEKSYFDVLGICCSSEVPLIEGILRPLDGVHDVSVIVPSRTVIVLHDPLIISQLIIVKALNQARLEANVRVKGENNYQKKWPSSYAIACGILLLLSFLRYLYHPFQWLALAAVVVGIAPIMLKAIAAARNFRLDINILMLIAVAGSIVLKDYWEAGTIVFLFTIAEWLESRASHKATAVMSSLMNIAPQRAVLAATGVEVDVGEVLVNTILSVKAGDIIPIDGIVVEGKCEVDEKTLTGESFPVAKQLESSVWAGTINLNGYISIKTTSLAEDCAVSRMAKLVEEAQNNKSKTQRFIDKCAVYYTPAVVIVSGCLAIIPAALRVDNRNEWYHLALVVLVSACPCALILSTPIATFCALSKAATSGLLIKGAEYLETLANLRVMAFDKTGTITRGEFVVADFHTLLEGLSLHELLYWVTSIESKSSHPMAAALVEYAHRHSIEPKPDQVEVFQNFPGEGIYGKINGKDIFVGNRKIASRAGCVAVPTLEGDKSEGKSIGYIFWGSSVAGIFSLSDVCRTGVAEALKELKSMGIRTAMLTGDCQAAAMHAQNQLGDALEIVHAELLPEDKARIIKDFQRNSPTAMVGDGLNDAPALATADIGISMGVSGSALATETGHIILMSNDIRKIPKAVRLARKTRRKIIENVILSVATKAGIIGLAIAGHPLVWAAVLADVGTCLLVIFNSMLLLRGAPTNGRNRSSSSHAHERGCKSKHGHSHNGHKHCSSASKIKCSDTKKKGCYNPASPVPTSCGSKTLDSRNTHDCCAHEHDHVKEAEHDLAHGMITIDIEGKAVSSKSKQGCCAHSNHVKETKPSNHGSNCDMITLDFQEGPVSEKTHVHEVSDQEVHTKKSCCSEKSHVHEVSDQEVRPKKRCCSEQSHVHEVSDQEVRPKKSCCSEKSHVYEVSDQEVRPKKSCCSEQSHVHEVSDQQVHSKKSCWSEKSHVHEVSDQEEVRPKKSCCSEKKHGHEKHDQETVCHSFFHEHEVNHCHNTITEEELDNMVRTCCKYYSSSQEAHSRCGNHGTPANGCCKSFNKTPHFELGGLSEIVIE